MTGYLARRAASLVPLFFGITFVSFAVMHLAPGTAADARAGMNPKMTAQARERLEKLYGLDKPVVERYGAWLGRTAHFDFGESFQDGEPVARKIGRAIPVTLLVNGLVLFFSLAFGIPLGLAAAARKGRLFDRVSGSLAMAALALPTFWIALILMKVVGVEWRLLPVSGIVSVFHDDMGPLEKALDAAKHLVLPVFTATLGGAAAVARYMRESTLVVLKQNYVRAARSKGLSAANVARRHVLPNAILPVVTLVGLSIPALLGGSVIFESIFSLPGMGRLFFQAVFSRDYPVIMGVLVMGAFLTLAGNLLADAAHLALDPRVRSGVKR